jgi:hypothetical protein
VVSSSALTPSAKLHHGTVKQTTSYDVIGLITVRMKCSSSWPLTAMPTPLIAMAARARGLGQADARYRQDVNGCGVNAQAKMCCRQIERPARARNP